MQKIKLIRVAAAIVLLCTSLSWGALVPQLEWDALYEGGIERENSFADVITTPDGGYLAVGTASGLTGLYKASLWAVKTDAGGEVEWERFYQGEYRILGCAVTMLPGGGYALLAKTLEPVPNMDHSAYWIGLVVHIDENGESTGQYKIDNGWYPRRINRLFFTSDKDVILASSCDPNQMPFRYSCMMRTDNQGNEKWFRMVPHSEVFRPHTAVETIGGGFLLTSSQLYADGNRDLIITALDYDGNEVWRRANRLEDPSFVGSPISDGNGGLILASKRNNQDGTGTTYMARVNSTGELLWAHQEPTCSSNFATVMYERAADDGLYIYGLDSTIAMGDTGYRFYWNTYVERYDAQGNWLGEAFYDLNNTQMPKGAVATDDGLLIAGAGNTEGFFHNFGILAKFVDTEMYIEERACFSPQIAQVVIDILPGNAQNPINTGKKGIIPIAVLSTTDFDARDIDPATADLSGAKTALKGNGWYKQEKDVNGDGLDDLVLHMACEGLYVEDNADELYFTAATFGGAAVEGSDTVKLVGKK